MHRRLSTLGAGLDVKQVGVETIRAEVHLVDELRRTEESLLSHRLKEYKVVRKFVLSQPVEEVKHRNDITCGCGDVELRLQNRLLAPRVRTRSETVVM